MYAFIKKILLSSVLILITGNSSIARTLSITAEFTPSMINPDKNQFTNTTPTSGYCAGDNAQGCLANGWFSIMIPGLRSDPIDEVKAEDKVSFKVPSLWRDVMVTNRATGESKLIKFSFNGLGATMTGYGGDSDHVSGQWVGGNGTLWSQAPEGCKTSGFGTGATAHYRWFWHWPNRDDSTDCGKTSTVNRGVNPRYDSFNIMYMMNTPNPHEMDDGIYEGQITYTVGGSGAEFNLGGPNYQVNDDQLTVNFVLTVTHELRVMPVETGILNLNACQPGKVCSDQQSIINWQKATISHIPPTLTAESNFSIWSSGSFVTYLQCEFSHGDDCGIKSDKTGAVIPVKTTLTLPNNILTSSGAPVKNMKMKNFKDSECALFRTDSLSTDGKGKFHFEVDRFDVLEMKKHAPDEYNGVVTIIFDPRFF